jgi:hypothetical protein
MYIFWIINALDIMDHRMRDLVLYISNLYLRVRASIHKRMNHLCLR